MTAAPQRVLMTDGRIRTLIVVLIAEAIGVGAGLALGPQLAAIAPRVVAAGAVTGVPALLVQWRRGTLRTALPGRAGRIGASLDDAAVANAALLAVLVAAGAFRIASPLSVAAITTGALALILVPLLVATAWWRALGPADGTPTRRPLVCAVAVSVLLAVCAPLVPWGPLSGIAAQLAHGSL